MRGKKVGNTDTLNVQEIIANLKTGTAVQHVIDLQKLTVMVTVSTNTELPVLPHGTKERNMFL